MARGILGRRRKERLKSTVWGGAWGLVIGGVIVAVASQLAVRHDLMLPQPEARAVETPAGTEFDQARPETDPALPAEETVPAADVAAATPARPAPADASPSFDTTPAAAPRPTFAGPETPGRPDVPRSADVALTDRAGLRPETAGAPEARAPLPPRTDRPAVVARDVPEAPVREAVPVVVEAAPETVAPVEPPVTETAEITPPVEDPAPSIVEVAETVEPAPQIVPETAPQTPEVARNEAEPSVEAAPAPVVASVETELPNAPEANDAPVVQAETAPADIPQQSDSPVIAAPAQPETEPTIPENPQLADAGGLPDPTPPRRIGAPGGSIEIAQAPTAESTMPGVPRAGVGRRVGSLTETETEEPDAVETTPVAPGGALTAYRRDFEADPSLARLAVVLIHESAAPPSPADLEGLPGEVSFAVDGGSLNASEIAAAYRAAGREVVLIPSLPPGAEPQDVEVALQANLAAVPEAVAVMDPGDAGFQNERAAVGQVVAVLNETGHGLITAPRGLNTAQQIAGRFDVPSALIFGELEGGDAGAISRALDRSAFRARQEAGVILVGRAGTETYQGLSTWLQGRNARSLAIAPVSAVLAPEVTEPEEPVEIEAEEESPAPDLPQVRAVPDSRTY